MKNCPGCSKEVDKHSIACQYCGRVIEKLMGEDAKKTPREESPSKKNNRK